MGRVAETARDVNRPHKVPICCLEDIAGLCRYNRALGTAIWHDFKLNKESCLLNKVAWVVVQRDANCHLIVAPLSTTSLLNRVAIVVIEDENGLIWGRHVGTAE